MLGRAFCALAAASFIAGCSLMGEPLTAAVLGAGTSTALGHSLNGAAYRTFTAPVRDVRKAMLEALAAMGMRVEYTESLEGGELIVARAEKRTIYIDLEPLTPRATRIQVVAKNGGLLHDSATATEIVLQTEKAFSGEEDFASRGATKRVRR
jgi:hypothetical protein